MSAEFEIREYQPEDEGAVLALVKQGLGSGPTGTGDETFWRWKHRQNPFGASLGLVATNHDGQIVGLRTFMQWRFVTGNTVVKAVRAVDTVTHPEYRRYGVFSSLTHKAVEQARNNGANLIFNTPNNRVMPGYLKLGWHYVSIVHPLVKVLNYPRFIAGILRNRKQRQSSGQSSVEQSFRNKLPSMTEFLSRSAAPEELLQRHNIKRNGNLSTDQSADYMWWRYARHPQIDYTVLYQEKSKALSGCLVLRPNTRFGLKEIVMDEMLLSRPEEGLADSLLDEMEKCISADYIIAYFPRNSFERRILHKHGFRQVPRVGMNFTVNILTPNLPFDPLVLGNWDISLGDLEIF